MIAFAFSPHFAVVLSASGRPTKKMLETLPIELLVAGGAAAGRTRPGQAQRPEDGVVSQRVRAAMREQIWPLFQLHVDIDVKSYLYWDDRLKGKSSECASTTCPSSSTCRCWRR
jgi:hypothetical protein